MIESDAAKPEAANRGPFADPGARLFALVTAFLAVFLGVTLGLKYLSPGATGEWERAVERHLDENPAANAFAPLMDAWRRTDWPAVRKHHEALSRVQRSRWVAEDNGELAELLENNAHLTTAVARSAAIPGVSLPATEGLGLRVPRPNLQDWELLMLVCVGNAARLEHNDYPREALQRLVELAVLGTRFAQPRTTATLTHHLVALAAVEMASVRILALLTAHDLPPTTLARTEVQLGMVEAQYLSIRHGLVAEADLYRTAVLERADNPAELAELVLAYRPELTPPEASEMAAMLVADSLSFAQAHTMFWQVLAEQLFLPAWRQEHLDRAWMEARTNNRLIALFYPEPGPLIVRETASIARLRLARQICLLRLNPSADAATILLDPFSGQPLRRAGDVIYSIGPDGVDDGAVMPWNPSAGAWSAGDIRVLVAGPGEPRETSNPPGEVE